MPKLFSNWSINALLVCMAFLLTKACLASDTSAVTITYDYEGFTKILETGKPNGIGPATALLALEGITTAHVFKYMPITRMKSEITRLDSPICRLQSVKNKQRESEFLFSLPLAFRTSNRLFMNASLPEVPTNLLNDNNEVISLNSLMLFYPASTLVTIKGISYGEHLDKEIAQINVDQLSIRQGFELYEVREKMFLRGRADFTIAFPSVIGKLKSSNKEVQFRQYKVANTPPMMTSHVMCNNTHQSRLFIEELNTKLRGLYSKPEFMKAHTDYLPQEERAAVVQHINQFAIDNTHSS